MTLLAGYSLSYRPVFNRPYHGPYGILSVSEGLRTKERLKLKIIRLSHLIFLNDLFKYVTSMFIFGYLLPSVIFLFSYGLVCFKIRSTNKNMERHGNLNGQKQRQRNSRPLKLIAGLVITYLVCYTPFHMYHLLRTMDVYLVPSSCTTFKRTHEA